MARTLGVGVGGLGKRGWPCSRAGACRRAHAFPGQGAARARSSLFLHHRPKILYRGSISVSVCFGSTRLASAVPGEQRCWHGHASASPAPASCVSARDCRRLPRARRPDNSLPCLPAPRRWPRTLHTGARKKERPNLGGICICMYACICMYLYARAAAQRAPCRRARCLPCLRCAGRQRERQRDNSSSRNTTAPLSAEPFMVCRQQQL